VADLSRNVHARVTSEHDTVGLDCWCSPRYCAPCQQCDGEGCFNCDRGLVEVTRTMAELANFPLVIVHHGVVESVTS
jgi:hypothetical protein